MKGSFYVFERRNPIFDLTFPSSVILCIICVASMDLKKNIFRIPFWHENPSKLLVKIPLNISFYLTRKIQMNVGAFSQNAS